jgi:hypothetical protein
MWLLAHFIILLLNNININLLNYIMGLFSTTKTWHWVKFQFFTMKRVTTSSWKESKMDECWDVRWLLTSSQSTGDTGSIWCEENFANCQHKQGSLFSGSKMSSRMSRNVASATSQKGLEIILCDLEAEGTQQKWSPERGFCFPVQGGIGPPHRRG